MTNTTSTNTDIAIIGYDCRFPGAENPTDFWENIENKVCSISEFTDEELHKEGISNDLLSNKNYIKRKGYIEDADMFDADFFRFSEHEAKLLDPQFRLMFHTTWNALNNAGYAKPDNKTKIGIFATSSNLDLYSINNLPTKRGGSLISDNFMAMLYNAKDFLANLIAYKLNLTGPAATIQTACSGSLVAVHQACTSLKNLEADIIIAGGTCVSTPLKSGHLYQEGMMLSAKGICSAFDEAADGIVLGNGAGAVVLKRLKDALRDNDTIHAVIKGSAINNDGNGKIGLTAPSITGQESVIKAALNNANITPDVITHIEAHGTGTILGDLIEIEALNRVFANVTKKISVGSIKPNIGHLDAASGIANLIKTILIVKSKTLPPNINYNKPSKQLNLEQKPLTINTESKPWDENHPFFAGVSSFGLGGTNAHLILTNPPSNHSGSKSKSTQLGPINKKRYWVSCKIEENIPGFKSIPAINEKLNSTPTKDNLTIIKEIFENFLCKTDINVNTKFSALGGDSLSALLITHEINNQLNMHIPFSIHGNDLTITEICKHIEKNIENRK